jgi:hypothetical protein
MNSELVFSEYQDLIATEGVSYRNAKLFFRYSWKEFSEKPFVSWEMDSLEDGLKVLRSVYMENKYNSETIESLLQSYRQKYKDGEIVYFCTWVDVKSFPVLLQFQKA